jgi:hypothetical protein
LKKKKKKKKKKKGVVMYVRAKAKGPILFIYLNQAR